MHRQMTVYLKTQNIIMMIIGRMECPDAISLQPRSHLEIFVLCSTQASILIWFQFKNQAVNLVLRFDRFTSPSGQNQDYF